jgi:uncharacterized protein (TIGR03435 family)
MCCRLIAALWCVVWCVPVAAQTLFEVASVRMSTDGPRGGRYSAIHGTLDARNVSMKLLIADAYGFEGFLIEGVPGWMNNDRVDVEAKAGRDATRAEMMPMLRALLEDRFQLKVHRETKEGPIFNLTVAKSGPKFQLLKDACGSTDPPCGVIKPGLNGLNRTMESVGAGMAIWTRILTLTLGRTIYDKTGLEGAFGAMRLEFALDDRPDATGPSLFTALPEQLGLKLEAGKGPVEYLVIDHIEKPSGN